MIQTRNQSKNSLLLHRPTVHITDNLYENNDKNTTKTLQRHDKNKTKHDKTTTQHNVFVVFIKFYNLCISLLHCC